jgi:oxygen-independent coproporphyrinogen-3 oxidase
MRAEFDFDPNAEITVECAPGQLADKALEALAAAGVNRVSLGVQSFIDREAALSGRLHSRAVVLDDLRRLRSAGIQNINIDLIAGLAGQSIASWEESLAVLADCSVPHASVYMLEVDQESRLGREVLAHGLRYHADSVPADDAIAEMYAIALDRLKQADLEQYEISNFSRTGMESGHNLRYWQRRPYLGVGLDASSMLKGNKRGPGGPRYSRPGGRRYSFMPRGSTMLVGDCEGVCSVLRTTTSDDLKGYLVGHELAESTWLTPAEQHEEAWFLGLRLNAGVDVAALEREFGPAMVAPALQIVERLCATGLVVSDDQTVRLTPRGQLLSNEVFQEFLGISAEEAIASTNRI